MKNKYLVIISVVLTAILLLSGCITDDNNSNQDQTNDNKETEDETIDQNDDNTSDGESYEPPNILLWPHSSDCQKVDDFKFDVSPIDVQDIAYIEPMGELTDIYSGHIIPGDHIAIHFNFGPTVPGIDVYALADGYLVMTERHTYTPPEGYPEDTRHYHLYFEYACSVYVGYVHVHELDSELLNASEELNELNSKEITYNENLYQRIPVKSGQRIGKSSAHGMLGMLTVDTNVLNTGYANPDNYGGQIWRLYAVAPFDYFEEPLKSQIYEKLPRTAEPRGGKIDFDIDGKLVGNWFQEGTNGINGTNTFIPGECGNNVCPYWHGHLSIVYDFVEPWQIRINIGHDTGISELTPYGVKGNAPDPADIGIEDGMTKYELVDLKDVSLEHGIDNTGGGNPIFTENKDEVIGVLLVQMIDEQTIKVEIFPYQIGDGISAFTENAKIYVR